MCPPSNAQNPPGTDGKKDTDRCYIPIGLRHWGQNVRADYHQNHFYFQIMTGPCVSKNLNLFQ